MLEQKQYIVKTPKFSVCIPNFNYLNYLKLTCASVTGQSYGNYEILISDNQSTDGSIDFIRQFSLLNNNVKVNINPVNLGFSANLEKASSMATGDYFILLSSDDQMNPGCLDAYAKVIHYYSNKKFVLGSSVNKIDSQGKTIGRSKPDSQFWRETDIDADLSDQLGFRVYKVPAHEMLGRSLKIMGNPYFFLTVCYPQSLFNQVGGYSGGRMYNPDKWFNWKLLTKAEFVLLIDEPLFSYRWHTQNQVALETSYGHLKYLVDEYRNTIELSNAMLQAGQIDKTSSEVIFIKRNIYRHGIGEFLKGRWLKSLRIFFFGLATFPGAMVKRPLFIPYMALLATTPLCSLVAGVIYKAFVSKK